MNAQKPQTDFDTLAHIEDIARLALFDIHDDDTWNGLSVSWSKP